MAPVPVDEAATMEESPAPAKYVSRKGNPPGIITHRTGKLQARLIGITVDGKAYQRPIPGLYDNNEKAVAAQAVARQKFDVGGVDAVWPPKKEGRNDRGKVRWRTAHHCAPVRCSSLLRVCLHDCAVCARRA